LSARNVRVGGVVLDEQDGGGGIGGAHGVL